MDKRRVAAGVIAASVLATSANAQEIFVMVPGIPGPYCAFGVEKRLLELGGVQAVKTDWRSERIRVVAVDGARLKKADIEAAVKRADYPYKYEIRMGRPR